MMKRRRPSADSLDLLLDTVTNTFGSILFLTMLIALLLRTTGKTESPNVDGSPPGGGDPLSHLEQARHAAHVDELASEIEILTRSLGEIPPSDPKLAQLQATVVEAVNEVGRLLQQDAALTVAIADDQRWIADSITASKQVEADLAAIREQATVEAERRKRAESEAADLAHFAVELDRPTQPSGVIQTNVPVLDQVAPDKRQVGLYLRYGRIYLMHQWGPDGERRGPNPGHFVITPRSGDSQTARARPDAGLPADGPLLREELGSLLKPFPADAWVVGFAVHQDSFDHFQAVKRALVALGYQYEPLPTGPNHGIQDSGGNARAQ